MAFTDSLCSECLRAVQADDPLPRIESLVLLGVDYAPGDSVQPVQSKHYACINCMSTWKATPRPSPPGAGHPERWEMIDKPD